MGLRTLHNGDYSELLKVGLSQFNSHLQRAVISAPLLEHRGPFDKSLCTGTAALFPHERNIFHFFLPSIIFAVHWLGRVSLSPLGEPLLLLHFIRLRYRQSSSVSHPASPSTYFNPSPPAQSAVVWCLMCALSRICHSEITPRACPQNPPTFILKGLGEV